MAKWGKCDFREIQRLRDNMAKLQEEGLDEFYVDATKELARKFLRLVIPRTPVGVYKNGTYTCAMGLTHQGHNVPGKNGGTLRRGWTAQTHDEAESGNGSGLGSIAACVASTPVKKSGTTYTIDIINSVEYASYVELGHRTPNGGWVQGHYFMDRSEKDVREELMPKTLKRMQEKVLKKVIDV